jgi:hypothetical protein
MLKYIIEKIISKKFIGWLGSCTFLYYDKINEQTWLVITLSYMGLEAGLNLIDRFKQNKEDGK